MSRALILHRSSNGRNPLPKTGLKNDRSMADGAIIAAIAFVLWRGVKASVHNVQTAEAAVG